MHLNGYTYVTIIKELMLSSLHQLRRVVECLSISDSTQKSAAE